MLKFIMLCLILSNHTVNEHVKFYTLHSEHISSERLRSLSNFLKNERIQRTHSRLPKKRIDVRLSSRKYQIHIVVREKKWCLQGPYYGDACGRGFTRPGALLSDSLCPPAIVPRTVP